MLIIEDILLVVFVLLAIWEVIIPMAMDRPYFPIFRRSQRLKEARALKDAAELDAEAARIEREAAKMNRRSNVKKEANAPSQSAASDSTSPTPTSSTTTNGVSNE